MILKKIHENLGAFNGSVFYEVNGLLMSLHIGTPNFNDYGEWNIYEISINHYKPEENTIELKPGKEFQIEITDKEFETLISYFGNSVEFITEINGSYDNDLLYPFSDKAVLTYGISEEKEEVVYNAKTDLFDNVNIYLNSEENDFPIYKILIPIMREIKNFYNKG